MSEASQTVDKNFIGVREPQRDSRQQILQECHGSLTTKDEERHWQQCFRESNQLFHDGLIQRRKIDQLVKIMVEETIMSDVETTYIFDNVVSRLKYLKNTEFVLANRTLNRKKLQKGYPLDRLLSWEGEKKIFAVWIDQDRYFPAFQFEAMKPRIIIEKVIRFLPDYMHGWHIAYWFSGGNGWLNGDLPQNNLHKEDEVLRAAKQLALGIHR